MEALTFLRYCPEPRVGGAGGGGGGGGGGIVVMFRIGTTLTAVVVPLAVNLVFSLARTASTAYVIITLSSSLVEK